MFMKAEAFVNDRVFPCLLCVEKEVMVLNFKNVVFSKNL